MPGYTSPDLIPYPLQTEAVDVADDTQQLATIVQNALNLKAPLASPALTGAPTAPTASVDTSTTQIATTAYVVGQGYLKSATASTTYAPINSPAFTGTPTIQTTPSPGDSTLKIPSTAFVGAAISTHAALFSGVHGVVGSVVGTSDAQTLTNKTISGATNTITSIPLAAVDGAAPLSIPVSTKTASFTVESSESGYLFWVNSTSGAVNATIPNNTDQPLPVGSTIVVAWGVGSNQVSFVAGSGVTLAATPGLKLRVLYASATAIKVATNTWLVTGDLVA